LGITHPTLQSLLRETGRQTRAGACSASPAGNGQPGAGVDASHPAVQIAIKQKRLDEIEAQIAPLAAEKAALQEELKRLYDRLGEILFGPS